MDMPNCRRRGLLAASAAAFLCAGLPALAVEDQAAIAPVNELIAGLQQVMKAGVAMPFSQRFAILAPIVARTFDLSAILRESVGLPWATLPPDQQAQLQTAFRQYTVATYVNNFSSSGPRFEVDPQTRAVGTEQVVQTEIIPKTGDSRKLDYVMRQVGADWRVVDVLADGSISRVAVQRSDFRQLLAHGGAPALVASLRSKSVDLSDGAG